MSDNTDIQQDDSAVDIPSITFEMPDIKITQVIRMNSTVLYVDQVLETVEDASARINATELLKSCWSFCTEHELPKPTKITFSQTLRSLGIERVYVKGRTFYTGIKYRTDPTHYAQLTKGHWRLTRMMERNDVPQLLTIMEFVRLFRISRRTWYRLVKRGEAPPTIKIGKRTLIPLHAADHWANAVGVVLREE